jgi:hypothetical protein
MKSFLVFLQLDSIIFVGKYRMKDRKCILIPYLLLILLLGCSKNEEPPNNLPLASRGHFQAFSLTGFAYTEILFDTLRNDVYVFENLLSGQVGVPGSVVRYNYKEGKVGAEGESPTYLTYYPLASSDFLGKHELYVGVGKSIYVIDGESLMVTDSFPVWDTLSSFQVSSITVENQGKLFVGGCSGGPIRVFDRTSKQLIAEDPGGGGCLRLRAYQDPDKSTINVIAIEFATSNPYLAINVYSNDGLFLSSQSDTWPQINPTPGLHLVKTSSGADYIVSSTEGHLYRKTDLSYIGTVGAGTVGTTYDDIILNDDGSKMYCLSRASTVDVFDYPSLTKSTAINLEERAIRGFIDEGKLVLIQFNPLSSPATISMTILDI